jgi:hypothetical protein
MISRLHSLEHPTTLKKDQVFAIETYCAGRDGVSAARIEEEVVVTDDGCRIITKFPGEELLVAGRTYVRGADLVPAGSSNGSSDGHGTEDVRPAEIAPGY